MANVKIVWSDNLNFNVNENSLIIVVDELRASSVIVTALSNQVKEVVVCENIKKCFSLENHILIGERHGKKINGFDYETDPVIFTEKFNGKKIGLNTGNFCHVIKKIAKKNCDIVVGCLLNAEAVAQYVKKNKYEDVFIISIGTYKLYGKTHKKPYRTSEDFLTCKYIAYKINNKLDMDFYLVKNKRELLEKLWKSYYARYLLRYDKKFKTNNYHMSIKFCYRFNIFDNVPKLKIGKLLKFV